MAGRLLGENYVVRQVLNTRSNTEIRLAATYEWPQHIAPYDRSDYRYSQSVEAEIVATMGGRIYGPYTGRHYRSFKDTDIEHIVAVSEAHDSGLCAAGPPLRRRFASDLLNLTLAAPEVNRCAGAGKCAYDAAEWLPPINRCWFAARVVAVKRK